MKENEFLKIIQKNYSEVKKWDDWKKRIIITAETAKTGKYLRSY